MGARCSWLAAVLALASPTQCLALLLSRSGQPLQRHPPRPQLLPAPTVLRASPCALAADAIAPLGPARLPTGHAVRRALSAAAAWIRALAALIRRWLRLSPAAEAGSRRLPAANARELRCVQGVATRDVEAVDAVYALFGYRPSPFYAALSRSPGPASFAASTSVQWLQACAFERSALERGLDQARFDMLKRLQAASIEEERKLQRGRAGEWPSWSFWRQGLGAVES